MTILGDDYEPIEVINLDLVGYMGSGAFVILRPFRHWNRSLPEEPFYGSIPICLRAKIVNNQAVNFGGDKATLHDVNGAWYFRLRRQLDGAALNKLEPHTFFEIGHCD